MNFDHLRYMIAIADCHSINKASKELHLKQQYLSSVAKKVEEQCGTTIFNRTNRGIRLTEDGIYLLERFRQIIDLYDEIILGYDYPSHKQIQDITCTIALYVLPGLSISKLQLVTQKLYDMFPHVKVVIFERPRQEVFHLLQSEEDSLAIMQTDDPDALQAQVPDDMLAIPLRQYELTAITSPANALADEKALSITDLLQKDLIFYAPLGIDNSPFYRILQSYGQANIKSVVSNSLLFLDLLKNNNYYSLGNSGMAEELAVRTIPLKEELYVGSVLLAERNHVDASLALRALINLLLTTNHQPPLERL